MIKPPKLDLIVTHYKEPWSVGKKFFDMLALQRGVNFSDFSVIFVQDGKDGEILWDNIDDWYPFDISIINIEHAGVSVARNTGLKEADTEWVMFCDFDDMFSTVYSLRMYFESMSDKYDMVFSSTYNEVEREDGRYRLDTFADNSIFIHGKMFRRLFLVDNNLLFEPGICYAEDTLFCNVVDTVLDPGRKKKINEVLYFRSYVEDSVSKDEKNSFRNAVSLFRMRWKLTAEYYDRGCIKNATGMVVKTILDYYYAVVGKAYPNIEWFEKDFWLFWSMYKDVFLSADHYLISYENNKAINEASQKGYIAIPTVSFYDWLRSMKDKYEKRDENG